MSPFLIMYLIVRRVYTRVCLMSLVYEARTIKRTSLVLSRQKYEPRIRGQARMRAVYEARTSSSAEQRGGKLHFFE